MSEFPKGWVLVDLGSVCEVVRGITFPASAKEATHTQSNVCCLRTSNIQREIDWRDVYFVPQEYVKRESQFVRPGDILMSMANSYELVGKVAVIRRDPLYPTAFGAFLSAIRTQVGIEGQYLFHLLRTEKIQRELRQGSSQTVNIANISVKTLSAIEIPLAPLNEQRRIADKLDRILAKVEACRERCDRIPLLLKRFRQSVLAAATSGQLTEDWREEQMSNLIEWPYSTTKELCEWITKGTTPSKDRMYERYGDVPYIKVYNLCFDGTLDFSVNPVFIDKETHEVTLKRSKVFPGDVLMNIVGPPLGKVSIVPELYPEWNINQAIALFRVRDRIYNKFLAYVLMSDKTLSDVTNKAKATAGQFNLTLEICREILVPVPSLEEQAEIVRRVETLFAYADRLEAQYQRARVHIDRLTPALLDKAFRGKLVPQDPKDEPASVLLARLQAGRAQGKSPFPRQRNSN